MTSGSARRSRRPTSTSRSSTTASASSPIAGSRTSASAASAKPAHSSRAVRGCNATDRSPSTRTGGSSRPVACTASVSCTRPASSCAAKVANVRCREIPRSPPWASVRATAARPRCSSRAASTTKQRTHYCHVRWWVVRLHGDRGSWETTWKSTSKVVPRSSRVQPVGSGRRSPRCSSTAAPASSASTSLPSPRAGWKVDASTSATRHRSTPRWPSSTRRSTCSATSRASHSRSRQSTSSASTSSGSATSPRRSHLAWVRRAASPTCRRTLETAGPSAEPSSTRCSRPPTSPLASPSASRASRTWVIPTCTRRSWCSSTPCDDRTRSTGSTAFA